MDKDRIEGKWTEIKGRLREAYGDLTDDPAFAEPFAKWLKTIGAKGVVATIEEYLAG